MFILIKMLDCNSARALAKAAIYADKSRDDINKDVF